jgi:hypothetical protein
MSSQWHAPRPNAYFVYGLISRLTAKHSAVLASEVTGGQINGTNRVFTAALRSPKGALTWMIVNDAPQSWQAHGTAKHTPASAAYQYQVSAAERARPDLRVDPNHKVPLRADGFEIVLPAQSLTILSSYELPHDRRGIFSD